MALDRGVQRLDAARFVRLDSDEQGDNYTLTVTDTAGQVRARRKLESPRLSYPDLWGTGLGPCVQDRSPQFHLTCYTVDLSKAWAKFSGEFTLVTRDGKTAFLAAEPSRELWLNLAHLDLKGGRREVWRLSTLPPGVSPDEAKQARLDLFQASPGGFGASVLRELPGKRVLACVKYTLPKWGCRYDVLDSLTGKRRTTLETQDVDTWFVSTPEVSRNGTYLAAYGNTVHVWETASGRRLRSLHDPAWAKSFAPGTWVEPFDAVFSADEKQLVVLVWDVDAPWTRQRAFVYALPTGRRVTSFSLPAR